MPCVLNEKIETAVFVLSTGRVGTEFLSKFFDTCFEEITGFHQPFPLRRFRVESNRHVAGHVSREHLKKIFTHMRGELLAKVQTPLYLEANNYLYGFTSALEELFERVVIFHVVRHPFSYLESQMNFTSYSGLKQIFMNYMPYWTPPRPEKCGVKDFSWKKMTLLEKYAWQWVSTNQYLDSLKNGKSSYHLIRFEDIFNEKASGLRYMVQALGFDWETAEKCKFEWKKYNKSRRKVVTSWRE